MANKIDYMNFVADALAKLKQGQRNLKKINILIAGKTGVGKSTLINTAFRENLATTGTGEPVTKTIRLIEKEGLPIRIYDTVGFELDPRDLKQSEKNIKKLVKKTSKTDDPDDDVHCMWYCVNALGGSFEEAEKGFIDDIIKQGIPVIVVLTKAYSKQSAEELRADITSRAQAVSDCIPVLAQSDEGVAAFGVSQLVEATCKIIPEAVQTSFVNAQQGSIALKRHVARQRVLMYSAATFGEGFVPLPLADAAMMAPTQTKMITDITTMYGIDIEKKTLETVIPAVLGVLGAIAGGKSLASSILKLIPGVGTAVGGVISGAVGGTITIALGNAYIELMELVIAGKVNLDAIAPDDLKKLFQGLLADYLQHSPSAQVKKAE
ncbi:YcjF family protein [Oenococcus sp.]|uniref:YcjF family protein n=1 Tax=Oenococcus sp. TaxID=1979414 RepID=UPI0039E9A68E